MTAAALGAQPADDVITFHVLPPLNSRGSQSSFEHLTAWLDGYDGHRHTAHDVQVSASHDLGVFS